MNCKNCFYHLEIYFLCRPKRLMWHINSTFKRKPGRTFEEKNRLTQTRGKNFRETFNNISVSFKTVNFNAQCSFGSKILLVNLTCEFQPTATLLKHKFKFNSVVLKSGGALSFLARYHCLGQLLCYCVSISCAGIKDSTGERPVPSVGCFAFPCIALLAHCTILVLRYKTKAKTKTAQWLANSNRTSTVTNLIMLFFIPSKKFRHSVCSVALRWWKGSDYWNKLQLSPATQIPMHLQR